MVENKEDTSIMQEPKLRLLIATDSFLPRWDGVTRFLSEIIPRLQDKYQITVLCPDMGTYEDPNIKIIRIPLSKVWKGGDFPLPQFKRSVIRKAVKSADIVFSQSIGPIGGNAILLAKRYRKPVSAFVHSIEWELWPRAIGNIFIRKYAKIFSKQLAKSIYDKCSLLIMPSNSVADIFAWNNVKTKTEVVNLGVDTEKFRPMEDPSLRNELRQRLGFLEGDIILGYHGRISREKDLVTLLRAFTRLQLYHPNIKLLIVGDGVESIKKQLLSRKDVTITGIKNNPVPYLQIMDVYCLTSLTETTCLSMLEALSCRIAVVSTEVGFIKSYIKNNVNGLFFDKQNPYHLARQVERIIQSPELRKRLSENARKTAIERFSWDKTANGIVKALDGLKKIK